MKNLLNTIGAGDGTGEVSHTRLINILVALCWLASKFYNSHLTQMAITWDTGDMEMLGVIGAISIGKSVVEKPAAPAQPISSGQS